MSLTLSEMVQLACIWEVTARKVGNVHPRADFSDTSYVDFLLSASVIAPGLAEQSRPGVGHKILKAVQATTRAIGKNTNLGIIMLLSPLCECAETDDLRTGLHAVLAGLSREDAGFAFEAIRIAKPGGLGSASRQDVLDEPTVTLLEAMALAEDRDLIARQYVHYFADVFDFGVPTLLKNYERFGCLEAAIIALHLSWLARECDSLITRKNGLAISGEVHRQAAEVMQRGGIATPDGRKAARLFDAYLRSNGNLLNPGSTADLVAACLFVALRENRITLSAPFAWMVEDWL